MTLNSKLQLEQILNFCESKLKFISNDSKFNGFVVFLIHLLIQLTSFYFLILHPLGFMFYYIVVVWTLILISNFYFHGCILTKLERRLWNTKEWYGPYFLYCEYFNLSTKCLDNLFICKIILITTFIFLRILFNY